MLGRIIKKFPKYTGIFIGIVFLLVILYITLNTPMGTKYKKLTDSDLQPYINHLDTTHSEPLEFVSEKFDDYDVVLLGEMHRRRQDLEFLGLLIQYLYDKKNITTFCWEFGASEFQKTVDSLVTAPEFDRKTAISLLRGAIHYWNYEEYLDIVKLIWELNTRIPSNQEKIRFLQFGSASNLRKLYSPDPEIRRQEAERFYYDKKMANIIEGEVLLKGKKALIYSGLHHAFTKYRQPRIFFMRRTGEKRRGGNFLFDKYPDRVYLIVLHLPVIHRWGMLGEVFPSLKKYFYKFYYPFGGVIDKAYDLYEKPFAFDTRSSLFGEIKDKYSYYSLDYLGGIKLSDFCDGYIVPCSFDEAEPVRLINDWITTEKEFETLKERLTLEDAARFNNISVFLNELEDNLKTFSNYHNVEKSDL